MSVSKRAFDLVCATIGLLLLWPLFVVVALLVKAEDGGPVFYRQERVGRHGHPFRIWKFRTMRVNADRIGRAITVGNDPRITRVGGKLRDWKIDELPQLINVLMGDMSLVGPRPEVARYVNLYTSDQRGVLELVPGITDLASIKYRHESEILSQATDPDEAYVHVIMPDKIAINLAYAKSASMWSDIRVIIQTAFRIVG
jgi:lipopolysaccharide/colanic/teichoic acid biosynthesis glycosyltransferase